MDTALLDTLIGSSLPEERFDVESVPDGIVLIDMVAMQVAVDLARASANRAELIRVLEEWPHTAWGQGVPALRDGPNYIQAGAALDDQRRALVLFAIGEALGFWKVITPKTMGIDGDEARRMAGQGFIMIDGYNPDGIPMHA